MRIKIIIALVIMALLLAGNAFQYYKSSKTEIQSEWWELKLGQPIPPRPEGMPDPKLPTMLGLGWPGDDRPDSFHLVQIYEGKTRIDRISPPPWNKRQPEGEAEYGSAVAVVTDIANETEIGMWESMKAEPQSDGGNKYVAERADARGYSDLLFFFTNPQGQITGFATPQAETKEEDRARINLSVPLRLREDRMYSVTITGSSVPTGLWVFQLWQGRLVQCVGHLPAYIEPPDVGYKRVFRYWNDKITDNIRFTFEPLSQ